MRNPYCLETLADTVAASLKKNAEQIEKAFAVYASRAKYRKEVGRPVVALCGFPGNGKDVAAEYICMRTKLTYAGSVSQFLLPLIVAVVGSEPKDAVWRDRVNHREYWLQFGKELCHQRNDPTFLQKMVLSKGDIVPGVRQLAELHSGLQDGVINYAIWVARRGLDSVEGFDVTENDCDFTIVNDGSLRQFYAKLDRLIQLLQY